MLEITNLTFSKINKKFLIKAADVASAVLNIEKEISLVFVCDARMKAINKKYRGKNRVTDVLSFGELNEIYICLPEARRQVKNQIPPTPPLQKGGTGGGVLRKGRAEKLLKTSLNSELTRLLVHGIVHLKGYNHEKSAVEAAKMRKIEEKILKNLRIKI